MSEVFRCDDKDTLVAYLYGDVEPGVRREVERHLRTCAACTRETEGLQAVRLNLQAWSPPDFDLGFTIQRSAPVEPVESGRVLTASRWARLGELPAWARVAAAALFLGIGLGAANVQVRSTSDGFVVTTGWMGTGTSAGVPMAASQPSIQPARADDAPWRAELAAVERALRRDFAARAVPVAASQPVETDAASDRAATLRRVREIVDGSIAASEERQRVELASRFIQAERMWNVRRQNDLVNVQRTVAGLQNRTIAVQANQQEAINQVMRRVNYAPPNQ